VALARTFERAYEAQDLKSLLLMIHPDVLASFGRTHCLGALGVGTSIPRAWSVPVGGTAATSWRNAQGVETKLAGVSRAARFRLRFEVPAGMKAVVIASSPSFSSVVMQDGREYILLDCSQKLCDEDCELGFASARALRPFQEAIDRGDHLAAASMVHPDVVRDFGLDRCVASLASCESTAPVLRALEPVARGCWQNEVGQAEWLREDLVVHRAALEHAWWSTGLVNYTKRRRVNVDITLGGDGPWVYLDCSQELCGRERVSSVCESR
jgi:hypothetical protein